MSVTACKVSKYGVIAGPNTGKYGPEITPYLDTFHAVVTKIGIMSHGHFDNSKQKWIYSHEYIFPFVQERLEENSLGKVRGEQLPWIEMFFMFRIYSPSMWVKS